MRLFNALRRDERGGLAILFAMALVPLVSAIAVAIDYGRLAQRYQRIQMALDMATLAVAREPPVEDSAVLASKLTNYMAPQLLKDGIKPEEWQLVSAKDVNGRLSATAKSTLSTRLSGVMGLSSMVAATSTEVARSQTKLEVALVMDNTGSMGNGTGRIEALRTAATSLVDALYKGPDAANKVRIALVPFVTTVNVKADKVYDSAWIDSMAKAPYHGANFNKNGDGTSANHLTLFQNLNVTWKGCVEARAEPYDTEDTAPDPAVPATLFVPWFWPDEPDPKDSKGNTISYTGGTAYNNNYMGDDYAVPRGTAIESTAAARQRNTTKYRLPHGTFAENQSETSGPNKSCPDPITPLTNDAATMRSRITAMIPWNNSGTNIAQGMVWGWSVLSPTPPFTEGVAYEDKETQKAMVVLTDGENEVFGGWATHNKSDYSGYGYLGLNRLGATDKAGGVQKVNEKVTALCDKIKAKGIRLYTITFQLGSTTGQELFRKCATKPELYYNSPTTAQLQGIFQAIAADLGNLRFSK